MNKTFLKQCTAEFIGTFFLVFMGCGAAIFHQIQPTAIPAFVIPLVFGGIISVMIYATGHISGAHFNPAVTLSFVIFRHFPLKRSIGYFIFQFSGAIAASMVHWILFAESSAHQYGITTLSPILSLTHGFLLEFIFSFLLMFVIISVATDTRAVGELAGLAIGSTVALCAYVGGPLTGASMNPARTLGPAILAGNFSHLWLYILAPCAGTIGGGICLHYDPLPSG